jgi:putative Mn2+ efflux pump MntP
MATLIYIHSFSFDKYFLHLIFDGAADAGGWYSYQFCRHRWHRVAVAVGFALITTLGLVMIVG